MTRGERTQQLVRSRLDQIRDPIFLHALNAWSESGPENPPVSALVERIRPRCDSSTNIYVTAMEGENILGYRLNIVSHAFSLRYASSFLFGDYPDRAYFENSVIPCYQALAEEQHPLFHRIHCQMQGVFAVYERMLLPHYAGRRLTSSVTVSKLLLRVDPPSGQTPDRLSARERQCLHLLAQGQSAKLIAATLQLRPATVENCVGRLKTKLGAKSAAQAAALATLYWTVGPKAAPRIFRSPPSTGLLSGRERQCLGYLASGLTVRQIAAELDLSAKTVEGQIASLKHKLKARNVVEATAIGIAQAYGVDRGEAA